jgi:hypothetical protein
VTEKVAPSIEFTHSGWIKVNLCLLLLYKCYIIENSDQSTVLGEAELAYARWYSALPTTRKAQTLCDLFQFGIDSVRYNAKKQNPYLTDSETMLFYFEKNLKTSFSPEVFEFIRSEMMKRAEIERETALNL